MRLLQIRRYLLSQRKFRQLLLSLIGVSIFLGILVVSVEKEAGSITTVSEGLWWAATTVTAVGYGDYAPITGPGRIIGVALQVVGVIMFGLIIALISTSINRSQEEFYWKRLFRQLDGLEAELKQLKKKANFMVKEDESRSS